MNSTLLYCILTFIAGIVIGHVFSYQLVKGYIKDAEDEVEKMRKNFYNILNPSQNENQKVDTDSEKKP